MADKYQAPDGTIFDTANAAQAYADAKVKEAAELNAARQRNQDNLTYNLNKIIQAYNAGNWDEIIDIMHENIKYHSLSHSVPSRYYLFLSIAEGKKGNWEGAIESLNAAKIGDSTPSDETSKLLQKAETTAKQAWENANGRTITDEEYNQLKLQLHLQHIERAINALQDLLDKGRDVGDQLNNEISEWEKCSGKKYRGSSSSTSSTSSVGDDQRNGFVSFLFGLVGAVGSVLGIKLFIIPRINLVDEWILVISICLYLIVPLVALGVTYSAWRNKRNILFIILLALIIPGYIGFIGTKAMSGKSPKPQTTQTEQTANTNPSAEITKNVNFRKGPSTNDEVIRQLKQGDMVILTGEVSGGWTQVTRDGEKGWVSNEYLKVWGGGQTAEPKTAPAQAAALTAFPSDFTGTWRRNDYNNTLTFSGKTLKSSSQSYTWNFVSETNNAYTIHSDTSGTAKINIRLLNGNIEISGDSGGGEDNWNGTWKKQ